jgi:hypothetical protein
MKKSELKQLIRETIEEVTMNEAPMTGATPYTFEQLNALIKKGVMVFVDTVAVSGEYHPVSKRGFFKAESFETGKLAWACETPNEGEMTYPDSFKKIYVSEMVKIVNVK